MVVNTNGRQHPHVREMHMKSCTSLYSCKGRQAGRHNYEALEQIFSTGKVELEQEWDTYVLPHVPSSYLGFNGEEVNITDQMVQEEFRFQTGLDPHHFHKSPREGSRTFILYLPRAQNQKRAPSRVLLFGDSIQVKHKPYLPKVIQCHQCWGFHDPHRCTRKPKCCLCSSPDHTEKFHPKIPLQAPKCTNCLGSHRADSPACKARPISQNRSIKHLPKSQLKAQLAIRT